MRQAKAHSMPAYPDGRRPSFLLNRIGQAIRARYNFILFCVVVVNIAVFCYYYGIERDYTATARLLTRQAKHLQAMEIMAPDMAIVTSRAMIESLITREQLYKIDALGGEAGAIAFHRLADTRQADIVKAVRERIAVETRGEGRLIEIAFRAETPALAASVANALADLYQQEVKTLATQEAAQSLEWISSRIDALGEQIRQDRLSPRRPLSNDEKEIMNFLQEAKASLQETEAELRKIDVVLYENEGPIIVPPFIRTPLFNALRDEEAALRAEMDREEANKDEWTRRYQAFQEKLEREVIHYANALQVKKEIEQAEIRSYEKKLADLQPSDENGSAATSLGQSVSQTVLADFIQSYMQALQDMQANTNPVRLLARAEPPQTPDRPDFKHMAFYATFVGLIVGVLLSVLSYFIRGRVESVADAEALAGLPVYAVLPFRKAKKDEKLTDIMRHDPSSILAERMRGLLTSIRLKAASAHDGAQVITVTSSCPNEGKTTFAIWLATVAAQNGRKVLIIDADMRRPSLHKAFGIGNAKGIADYLSDRLPLADTIHKKHPSGVHIMTSKAIPVHALMLLSGDRMEALIRRLREIYDFIILDTPSSCVFSEGRMLMRLSDQGFYLIDAGRTPRDVFCNAVKHFHDDGHDELSLILNKTKDGNLQRLNRLGMGYLAAKPSK